MRRGSMRVLRRSRFVRLALAIATVLVATPLTSLAPQGTHADSVTPTITSLSPEAGTTGGGTTVTITGTNFQSGITTVSFGTVAGTNVTVDPNSGGTKLTVVTPSEGAGQVTVTATNAALTSPVTPPVTTYQFVDPGTYMPVTPTRICDTASDGNTTPCAGQTLVPTNNMESLTFTATGQADIPPGASAVIFNLSLVPTNQSGWVTVTPPGLATATPGMSTMSYLAGRNTENLVATPVDGNGAVQLTVQTSSNTGALDAVVDVEGYIASGNTGPAGLINSVPSALICDTRPGNATPCVGKTLGTAGNGGLLTENVQVTGKGQIPSNGVSAVVINLSATNQSGGGYLMAYSAGSPPPSPVADLLWSSPGAVSIREVVPVSSSGQITVSLNSGTADFAVEVSGWYTDDSNPLATGALYNASVDVRICDTSSSGNQCSGSGVSAGAANALSVQVAGTAGLPPAMAPSSAVALNVTVFGVSCGTYVSVYPDNAQSGGGDVNVGTGSVSANLLLIVPLGPTGKVKVYNNCGTVQVWVDVLGYYTGGRGPTTWTQDQPATSPPARSGFSMAYDGVNARVLLFGGSTSSVPLSTTYLNDSWAFDETTWTQLSPAASPSPRSNAMMTWDAATNSVLLFGGTTASGDVNDTWTWNGTTWTQLFPSTSPSPRDSGYVAYSAALGQVVLFGGSGNTDTWTWNGSNWTLQAHTGQDPTASGGAIAYDAATQNVVYQMASNAFPTYNWAPVCCNQPPTQGAWGLQGYVGQPNSTGSTMAYFPAGQATIMFGGGSAGPLGSPINNATWAYNGLQWSQLSPTTSPSARYGAVMVNDALTGDDILFGGTDANGNVLNDTWTWDPPALWGVDSLSQITPGQLNALKAQWGGGTAYPDFYGRYLNTITPPGGSPVPGLTTTEVGYAHADHTRMLLIYSDPNGYSETQASNGTNAANAAISLAHTLGAPSGVAIMADIEPNKAVSSTYLQQWHDAFTSSTNAPYGYRPGFYFDPTPANSQFSNGAYCGAPASIRNSVLWSARPKVNATSKAMEPAFGPTRVNCASVSQANTGWQYTISQNVANGNKVDEDEWLQSGASLLW